MLKIVYKIVVLVFVFIGSVVLFVRGIDNNKIDFSKAVEMDSETFPILSLQTQGITCNRLYGYSGNINNLIIRESITPLDATKSITVFMEKSKSEIKKITYELRDTNDTLLDTNAINAISEADGKEYVKINFGYNFETSKEYVLQIVGITNDGRKIHYYTRLKYYTDDSFMKAKTDFAMNFHQMTLDKSKQNEVTSYLEPLGSQDNSSLSQVNIHSNIKNVMWAGMNPKVVTEIIPTVKEFNIETECVEFDYMVNATTSTGNEDFLVKEYYRVRFTQGRMYLLSFERTMETMYSTANTSIAKSELKLGVTNNSNTVPVTDPTNKIVSFVRNGALYQYQMDTNQMSQIYSFNSKDAGYEYKLNNQNDIKIIKLDDKGNEYFASYGYISRGAYEGKVAIILYLYHKQENVIEELAYIPLETTYQMLKEDFEKFCYVNNQSIFYFEINNVVYSYNIISRKLQTIAENVSKDNFMILESAKSYVWSSALNGDYGDSIIIYDLESDIKKELKAPDGTYIKLLGTIDSNIVYGYINKNDVSKKSDGTTMIPIYRIDIVDRDSNVLKTYEKKNVYVTGVSIQNNVITMERCKKVKNGNNNQYNKMDPDSILNQTQPVSSVVNVTSRVTDALLTEWYLSLPSTVIINQVPEESVSKTLVMNKETALHIEKPNILKYYVNAYGRVTVSYENPGAAIKTADEQMGTVIDSNYQVIWERGGRFNSNAVGGITPANKGGGVTSLGACAYMMLKANHIDANAETLSSDKKSIYNLLGEYVKNPLNLTKSNLDEVLYFVSKGKPVIAMKSGNDAVLITAYDETTVTFYDPSSQTTSRMSQSEADKLFEAAGNIFISYMS